MTIAFLPVDPDRPEPDLIDRAAEVLRRGGLVAFPTETVYGLGANALDPAAVRRIFAAKGRPAFNPLIVHVADIEQARELAADWPAAAQALAERFWPGSLTLVVPRRAIVPDEITAGGPTVALRVPAHPVALALIRAAGVPIAAPSANRSTHLSPTRARHVLASLSEAVDLLLDAGPTPGGLESTVVDVTCTPARLLRPGLVAPAQLEEIIGPVEQFSPAAGTEEPRRSPGLLGRHYAPRTPLECVAPSESARVAELLRQGRRVGWLTFPESPAVSLPGLLRLELPCEPGAYAAGLYAALHELDAAGVERIIVTLPPPDEEWLAIHDRLRRAAL